MLTTKQELEKRIRCYEKFVVVTFSLLTPVISYSFLFSGGSRDQRYEDPVEIKPFFETRELDRLSVRDITLDVGFGSTQNFFPSTRTETEHMYVKERLLFLLL